MFTRTPKSLKTESSAFASVPSAELEFLDSHSTALQMAPGRVVMRQGDHGREALLVVSGHLEVERDGERVALVGPGAIVGEMALLRNEPRNATVTAVSNVRVLALSRREFVSVLDRCPTLAGLLLSHTETRELPLAA